MSMITGTISTRGNQSQRIIQFKTPDRSAAVSVSTSKSAPKKKKRLPYNFKAISAQIMLSKTSGGAGKAVTKARGTIAMLLRKVRSGEYDDQELELAIKHARKMERVAKKRVKHLKQEEAIEKEKHSEELEDDLAAELTDTDEDEELLEISEEELQQLLEEYEELMRESMEELARETSLEELSEEFAGAVYDMSAEDLEELKKKHRSDEMREIMDADMKYLRAIFNKLEKEKQALSSGSAQSDSPQAPAAGVSLELSGLDMPVQTSEMPVMAEGGSVDVTV